MIEFAFVLPIFMFLLMFVVDMGNLVLQSGAMQDATFSAARTGAQVGGGGISTAGSGSVVCGDGGDCSNGAARANLNATAAQIPGNGKLGQIVSMEVVRGNKCTIDQPNVTLRTTYSTQLVTPGLAGMLRLATGTSGTSAADGNWTLRATATARCEVIRP